MNSGACPAGIPGLCWYVSSYKPCRLSTHPYDNGLIEPPAQGFTCFAAYAQALGNLTTKAYIPVLPGSGRRTADRSLPLWKSGQ